MAVRNRKRKEQYAENSIRLERGTDLARVFWRLTVRNSGHFTKNKAPFACGMVLEKKEGNLRQTCISRSQVREFRARCVVTFTGYRRR